MPPTHPIERRLAAARTDGTYTPAGTTTNIILESPPAERALPRWIRAPVRGPEYWTGFSRSKLYELAQDGKIQSISIREEGQRKGTRLFELKSILAFIESRVAAQKAAEGMDSQP
jgi:hypothetical protein